MRKLKIGRYAVPLWLLAVILISLFGSVVGYYVWKTLNIPLEVKEPIEILTYPSPLSLYPGENLPFDITVNNHASVNYSVILDFRLNNVTYQNSYVDFSDEVYTVIPGQQNLAAWLSVDSGAPSIDESLTIDFLRYAYPYTLTNGLIAYWKFNEGHGGIVSDSSGNNNDGTLGPGGPTWVNGKFGKALNFDGVDDWLGVPTLFSSSPSAVTVSAWINSPLSKWSSVFYHGDNCEIALDTGNVDPPYPPYVNLVNPEAAYFKCDLNNPTWTFVHSKNMTQNAWHNIVGVWIKGVALRIYVDGMLAGESTAILDAYPYDPGPTYQATIGSFNRGAEVPGLDTFFNGTIDNVMVYNRALTVQEVETLYTSPPP